jgi:hypothetical protein
MQPTSEQTDQSQTNGPIESGGADQASPNSHRQTVLRSLHQALHAMQAGDFSIRLAIAGEGIEAKISLRATSPLRSNSNRSGYSAAMGNGIGSRPI